MHPMNYSTVLAQYQIGVDGSMNSKHRRHIWKYRNIYHSGVYGRSIKSMFFCYEVIADHYE